MSLELNRCRPLSKSDIERGKLFLAWEDIKLRLATADIAMVRNLIAVELHCKARASVLRKLVSKYNALQARENEFELAKELNRRGA